MPEQVAVRLVTLSGCSRWHLAGAVGGIGHLLRVSQWYPGERAQTILNQSGSNKRGQDAGRIPSLTIRTWAQLSDWNSSRSNPSAKAMPDIDMICAKSRQQLRVLAER